MFKFLFFSLICVLIPLSLVNAFTLVDIDDVTKDIQINKNLLPRYIQAIYTSRAEYLKNKIKHFESDKQPLICLGQSKDGWEVHTERKSYNSGNSSMTRLYENILGIYHGQLNIFDKDPFTLYRNPTTPMKIDPLNSGDLSILYWHTAALLHKTYKSSQVNLKSIPSGSIEEYLYEPFFLDEESARDDLVSIIRVIRPHLYEARDQLENKKFLNEGDEALKDLKKLAVEALAVEKLINDLEDNLRDRIDFYDGRGQTLFPQGAESAEPLKAQEPPVLISDSIIIKTEEKPVSKNAKRRARRVAELENSSLMTSKLETPSESSAGGRKKRSRKKVTPSLSTPPLAVGQGEKEVLNAFPNIAKEKKEPIELIERKHLQGRETPDQKLKIKTRPTNGLDYLQSLNGLFDDELPPLEIAKKNLRLRGKETRSIKKESEKEKEKEGEATTAKLLHGSQRKVLDDLLYSRDTNTIDVDKSLTLLESFGFIQKPTSVQHTSKQHPKLKAKPVELWLGGERTLLEVPEIPCVTLAVSHKSGGKRCFKPYIVQKLRDALFKAGIDRLLL
ncbi:MAG TPA: hypothetical protein VMW10_04660 [Alphaproteobacteria bacterium]|nr:hypothetical protein [Alphaproteobacteria bacterium]